MLKFVKHVKIVSSNLRNGSREYSINRWNYSIHLKVDHYTVIFRLVQNSDLPDFFVHLLFIIQIKFHLNVSDKKISKECDISRRDSNITSCVFVNIVQSKPKYVRKLSSS